MDRSNPAGISGRWKMGDDEPTDVLPSTYKRNQLMR